MVSMDELAKKKTGMNRTEESRENTVVDPMAELEAAINKIDSLEAKDLLRTQTRLIKAKLEETDAGNRAKK